MDKGCILSTYNLDSVQKHLVVGEELFPSLQSIYERRSVASLSLLYSYFHECVQMNYTREFQ